MSVNRIVQFQQAAVSQPNKPTYSVKPVIPSKLQETCRKLGLELDQVVFYVNSPKYEGTVNPEFILNLASLRITLQVGMSKSFGNKPNSQEVIKQCEALQEVFQKMAKDSSYKVDPTLRAMWSKVTPLISLLVLISRSPNTV